MKMEETKTTLNYKLSYVNSFSNSTRKNVEELRKTFCRESGIYIYIYISFSLPVKLLIYFQVKIVIKMSEFLCIIQVGFPRMQIQLYWWNFTLGNWQKNSYIQIVIRKSVLRRLVWWKPFTIIDSASSSFRLKLKEVFYKSSWRLT